MITASIDPRKLKGLQRSLSRFGKQTDRARATAANRAAKSTVAEFSRLTRAEVNVKAARLKKMAKITRANPASPAAHISLTGAHVPLADMGARQTRKGVTVKINKSAGRKVIKRAFIATMSSGHRGVFRRTTKKRLPIDEKFGPSAMNLWQHRDKKLQAYGTRKLKEELKRAIQYATRRRTQ